MQVSGQFLEGFFLVTQFVVGQTGQQQHLAVQGQHGGIDRIEQLNHLFQRGLDRDLVAAAGRDHRLQVVGARFARFDGQYLGHLARRVVHTTHVDQEAGPGDAWIEILRIDPGSLGVGRQRALQIALQMQDRGAGVPGDGVIRGQGQRLVGNRGGASQVTGTNVDRRLRQSYRHRTGIERPRFLQRRQRRVVMAVFSLGVGAQQQDVDLRRRRQATRGNALQQGAVLALFQIGLPEQHDDFRPADAKL